MSTEKPTFEFGLSIGVSHNLSKLLGGLGCFHATQLEMESVKNVINDSTAHQVAARVFELANVEPPVVEIDDECTVTAYNYGDGGFGEAYLQPSFITGPYNTPDLVGVPEDSEYLFAKNRSDKVNRQNRA